jgi:hypothetical protein
VADGDRSRVEDLLARGASTGDERLLDAIGESRDIEVVEKQLDTAEPAMRRAAAEGLCFAGHRQPLLDRVRDEEVYPFAIRLVARGPDDIATFRELAELAPPETHRQEWMQTMRASADRLPADELIEADTILESLPHVNGQLRAGVLARVADLPAGALPADELSALQGRLVRLRLELADYQGAYDVVARINGNPTTPELRQLGFKAAVLSGHYDEAAAMNGDVREWARLYDELTVQRPQAAGAVREEIRRRFGDNLDSELAELLRVADERLMQFTASADPARSGPPE